MYDSTFYFSLFTFSLLERRLLEKLGTVELGFLRPDRPPREEMGGRGVVAAFVEVHAGLETAPVGQRMAATTLLGDGQRERPAVMALAPVARHPSAKPP